MMKVLYHGTLTDDQLLDLTFTALSHHCLETQGKISYQDFTQVNLLKVSHGKWSFHTSHKFNSILQIIEAISVSNWDRDNYRYILLHIFQCSINSVLCPSYLCLQMSTVFT